MIRTKRRLRLCVTLLCLNLIFIWGNSLLPGEISGALSDWLKNVLSALLGSTPGGAGGGGLLRKLAHFTEFTCLGMCLCWLFGMVRSKKTEQLLLPLACGFTAACIDETIQLFIPLRGPSIKDVGIDTAGVILGIVFITLFSCMKKNKINQHLEENKR